VHITGDIEKGVEIVNNTYSSLQSVAGVIDDINHRISDMGTAMENQDNDIALVEKQAKRVEEYSKSVTTAILEQKASMEETSKSIQRLTEMAQSINANGEEIFNGAGLVSEKTQLLAQVIESVNKEEKHQNSGDENL